MNTNAKFVTGDIKPVSCLDPYVNVADYVMCTKYANGTDQGFCIYTWWPVFDDQRPLWTSFKNRYGSKNNANWINAYKDRGSFTNLLAHANNLGQNLAWYYEPDDLDINSDYRIWTFGSSAWQTGFLRRYSQKVTSYYKCYDFNCATCESEDGTWVLYNTIYGEMREDLLP